MKGILIVSLLTFSFVYSKEFLIMFEKDGEFKIRKANSYIKELTQNDIFIEPIHKVKKTLSPNDEFYYSESLIPQYWWTFIRAPQAWNLLDSQDVVYIAILDTGVDYNHPDLKDNLWINKGETLGVDLDDNGIDDGCEDTVDNDSNGFVDDCYGINALCYQYNQNGDIEYNPSSSECSGLDAYDNDGHGTHVAGIIGAVTNNGIGVPGVLWNKVRIVPCKFLGQDGIGTTEGMLICLDYIKQLKDAGMNIVAINASYGGFYKDSSIEKVKISQFSDVLFISAAGNEGKNVDMTNFNPCSYSLPNQVCVGASNQYNEKAAFSNYGFNKVNIYSPGVEVLSTYALQKHDYIMLSGTSQATPFVTGAVGILALMNPTLTISQIKDRIIYAGNNFPDKMAGFSFSCNILDLYSILVPDDLQKICLDKLSYDFGQVYIGNSKSTSFTVRSTGIVPLHISSITVPSQEFIIDENCSGKQISSGDICFINISFSPSKNEEFHSIVTINYGNDKNLSITLQGTGISDSDNGSNSNGGGCSAGSTLDYFSYIILVALYVIRTSVRRYGDIFSKTKNR